MKSLYASFLILLSTLTAGILLLTTGCDIDGGDEVVREVEVDISGVYTNAGGIPERQSGNRITSLSLSQSGDQLNVRDNEGTRWTGTIGRASDTLATVTLNGLTTDGVEVVITGTIQINGTTATMSGTWVEPGLTANVSATATIAAAATPSPTPGPTTSATATPTP